MFDCLTLDQFEALVEQTGDQFPQEVTSHLEVCETCRQRIQEVRDNLKLFAQCKDADLGDLADISSAIACDSVAADTSAGGEFPTLPGYEILEEIHCGAQGVVYKAMQRSTKRPVALKVLLHGPYASRRQKHRFEREIEIVATLEHANIVRLYESGKSGGRHYFAMQYIEGMPLDEYVRTYLVGEREILELFVKIFRAVAYAHQHGVIHRDLKPSNIRVDSSGEPYVLDFGLAKPTEAIHGYDTLATQDGEFFGTLAYASPEQVSGNLDAINTRTDVYALGVILYELLTEHRPYAVDGSISMVIHNIVEVEPRKPSDVCKHRRLNDEIDRLIGKALAKDLRRRYPSADALADDVQRYLDGRPIEAKSDSGWYVLRKNLTRHKLAATFIAALILVISVALFVSLAYWRDAVEQRDRAVAAEQLAETQKNRAQEQGRTLRRTLYSHKIALAHNAYDSNDIAELVRVLDECPPDLRGWEWYYLRQNSDLSDIIMQLKDGVECVAVSTDGQHFVTGTGVGQVIVWNTKTALLERTMVGHTGSVLSVAFSPDDKYVASGGWDNVARIWEARTGREILALRGHEGGRYPGVQAVAFSPDGKRIVTGGGDNTLRLWDAVTGKQILVFPFPSSSPEDYVRFVTFFPDGKRVIAGGEADGAIRIWNTIRGQEDRVIRGHTGAVTAAAISADGRRIATASLDKTVRIWQAETGQEQLTLKGHKNWVFSVAFSPDEKRVLSSSRDGTIRMWNAETGAQIKIYSGHTSHVTCAAFHPSGTFFISGSLDKTVRIWSTGEGRNRKIWRTHERGVGAAVFAPDGKRFASVGLNDRTLKVYDIESGIQTLSIPAHEAGITDVEYAPDGSAILTASSDKTLKTWDARTGKPLQTFLGHENEVFDSAYSPDGTKIVSAGGDKTVRLWDAKTGQQLKTYVHNAQIWEIAYSPTGHVVAFGGDDKNVTLWSPEQGRVLHTLTGHKAAVDALAFRPDGKRLLSGAWDKTFKMWNVDSGRMEAEWYTSEDRIYCVAFSPDGERIVSGHRRKISIWDPASGRLLLTIPAHDDSIYSVSFSPDGRALLSASADGAVKLWPASAASNRPSNGPPPRNNARPGGRQRRDR